MPGLPEEAATLGEVLSEVSDLLYYKYDFGDGWTHRIELIETASGEPDSPVVQILGGARSCPPEDCGGSFGYQDLLKSFADQYALENEDVLDWADGMVGPWRDFDPAWFDIDAINEELRYQFPSQDQPPPRDSILGRLTTQIPGYLRTEFRSWVHRSGAAVALAIDRDSAEAMVRPHSWLLNQIGPDGLKLTQAGWLPPKIVTAAMFELGREEDWFGKMNREDQIYPVMDLRDNATRLGLIRKYKGRLKATKETLSLLDDPPALLDLIAARLVGSYADRGVRVGCALFLTQVSMEDGDVADDYHWIASDTLGLLGFANYEGDPIEPDFVRPLLMDVLHDLLRLSVFRGRRPSHLLDDGGRPTDAGRAFARLALRSGQPIE